MTTRTPYPISPTLARRLAISRQQLAGLLRPAAGPEAIMDVVSHIRCLQLDPISVVARSHQIVLWSRLGDYNLADLDTLLWHENQMFEYWAHAASIVLTEDYPIHNYYMRTWGSGNSAWGGKMRSWLAENESFRQYILAELAQNGPLFPTQLEDKSTVAWKSGGWTADRNVDRMLSLLWEQGQIMVAGRAGLKRKWDLAERCLPAWTPREQLAEPELTRRTAQLSLRGLGVARPKHIKRHFTRDGYANLDAVLSDLETEGVIQRIAIEDGATTWPGTWYIHADDLPLLRQLEAGNWHPRTTLLSPFDNLICDRKRSEELFNFRYRSEIYTPKAKRQYGYYVLPILHGDRFAGRIDPKLDRKRKRLIIHAIHLEPDSAVAASTQIAQATAAAIESLAQFLGATEIEYPEAIPQTWKSAF